MPTVTAIPLTDYTWLQVQGPEAQRFLQGQLTCDLRAVDDGTASLGGHCDPRGRLVSSFRIARVSEGTYWLRVPDDIAETALAQLQKYAVFSRAEVEARPLHGWALLDTDPPAVPEQAGATPPVGGACAPDTERVWLRVADSAWETWGVEPWPVPDGWATAEPTAWTAFRVQQGLGEVHANTSGAFIPQTLNFHLTGGISFTKGCYTGQEVVARMKYRGKLKRHMYRFQGPDTPPTPGTPVHTPDKNTPVGQVVFGAPGDLLAVVTANAVAAGALRLGGADGPALTRLPLPYDPEAEDNAR
jgi:folate-binding protein YgfZ